MKFYTGIEIEPSMNKYWN